MELARKFCEPCEGAGNILSTEEARAHLAKLSGWTIVENGTMIEREWHFRDFARALDFVNRVGALAEREGHHPDICFGWGYVALRFTTHALGGLHENDFIMAAKVETV